VTRFEKENAMSDYSADDEYCEWIEVWDEENYYIEWVCY
jgi:hypothetical protein